MIELAELRRTLRSQGNTYIYAIQAGEDGPVKIGTAKNPHERLLTFQTANAVRLRGVAAWWGSEAEERMWHGVFKDVRLEGEWFQPTEDLLAVAEFMGGGANCEFYRERDCLAGGPDWPLSGACRACGIQFSEAA